MSRLPLIVAIFVLGTIALCVLKYSTRFEYASDGSFIAINLTELDTSEQIQAAFQHIVNQRVQTDGFRKFQATNGSADFFFIQCYNCPRGVPMFSMFCYQRIESGHWLLRGYVPVNDYDYTDAPGKDFSSQALKIFNEGGYTQVTFRNATIFSISTNWFKPTFKGVNP